MTHVGWRPSRAHTEGAVASKFEGQSALVLSEHTKPGFRRVLSVNIPAVLPVILRQAGTGSAGTIWKMWYTMRDFAFLVRSCTKNNATGSRRTDVRLVSASIVQKLSCHERVTVEVNT